MSSRIGSSIPRIVMQGELELVPFDTSRMLTEIRKAHFQQITADVTCRYGVMETLACIIQPQPERRIISLHSILNAPETPEYVVRHILVHELIHIEIPPRDLREYEHDPRQTSRSKHSPRAHPCEPLGPIAHPPEFWVRERELSPEGSRAMEWIWDNHGYWLKIDRKKERIKVNSKWFREGRKPRPVFAHR